MISLKIASGSTVPTIIAEASVSLIDASNSSASLSLAVLALLRHLGSPLERLLGYLSPDYLCHDEPTIYLSQPLRKVSLNCAGIAAIGFKLVDDILYPSHFTKTSRFALVPRSSRTISTSYNQFMSAQALDYN